MDEGIPNEPTFRAKKRQKVYRKRVDSADADESIITSTAQPQSITNHPPTLNDEETAPVRIQRKPGVKKHGIAFSSSESRRDGERDAEAEKALVLAQVEAGQQDAPGADRFVRPTGKVAVTEDRHMMAYIDSRLAEARSVTPADTDNEVEEAMKMPHGQHDGTAPIGNEDDAATTRIDASAKDRTSQAAQQHSTPRPTTRRPKRSRRPERGADDIARDSMIDQIMHEAQVPLYSTPSDSKPTAATDAGDDNDEAAAEAFKAQLLAEMQMHNRRRPVSKAAAAAGGKDAKVSSGPKLGGSRSQRERMKAMEEAKGVKK